MPLMARTYFAQAADGTFYETTEGLTSFSAVVDDIATGQYEVSRVWCASADLDANRNDFVRLDDVTEMVQQAVYDALYRRGPGFVPKFLPDRDAELLRNDWMCLAERRANEAANRADRMRDERVAA